MLRENLYQNHNHEKLPVLDLYLQEVLIYQQLQFSQVGAEPDRGFWMVLCNIALETDSALAAYNYFLTTCKK